MQVFTVIFTPSYLFIKLVSFPLLLTLVPLVTVFTSLFICFLSLGSVHFNNVSVYEIFTPSYLFIKHSSYLLLLVFFGFSLPSFLCLLISCCSGHFHFLLPHTPSSPVMSVLTLIFIWSSFMFLLLLWCSLYFPSFTLLKRISFHLFLSLAPI